jgi:predicted  nucleic acid-binding Zn-ribbon protein
MAHDSELMKEKDAKIAQLEQKLQALKEQQGEAERSKGSQSAAHLEAELQKKNDEIQFLSAKIQKMEETYNEELVELKKEYFRACAIGIVQQRKITKDLPPVAELYKRCLDDNTEWKDYVPWIKTTLPKK